MPDYREMYGILFRATEQAINLLIAAQRRCEELFLDAEEPVIRLAEPPSREDGERPEEGE